jgi:hypothetical protein
MLPLFTSPGAFAGLAALPVVVGIYWLRMRFRRRTVSSLMLWLNQRMPREGGLRIDRLQKPLLLLLELLAISLLVLAAAGPRILVARGSRPLIVVLDDSYSMLAGGTDSPRSRALKAIREEIGRGNSYSVRFVLAGSKPQLLGDAVKSSAEADEILAGWHCLAPSAALAEAVTLASEVGGERAMLLVITDRAPAAPLEKGRVQWWAFGRPLPNVAFVNAARSAGDAKDRCLLEIANLSNEEGSTTLRVALASRDNAATDGESASPLQESKLVLKPREIRRVIFEVKSGTGPLRAWLDDDALAIDNEVYLLPETRRPVRVSLRISDKNLLVPIQKAVRAMRGTSLNHPEADLFLSDDDPHAGLGPDCWTVQLMSEKGAVPYVGPFVLDRTHPLTEGLSLQGVVWGAGKKEQIPGAFVASAGNIPLITDQESLSGKHALRVRLRPDLSTLQDSPDWPILIANLIQWRAAQGPGLQRANLRLGSDASMRFDAGTESVRLIDPAKKEHALAVHGRTVVVPADNVGVYHVFGAKNELAFASNALYQDESDLTGNSSGQFGDWLDETTLQTDYRSIAWVFLILAAAVLTVHMVMVKGGSHRGHRERGDAFNSVPSVARN